MGEIEPAARKLGIEIIPLPVRGAEDIALAFEVPDRVLALADEVIE